MIALSFVFKDCFFKFIMILFNLRRLLSICIFLRLLMMYDDIFKVMDPILPLGVLSGCLSAYAGMKTSWVKRDAGDVSCIYDPPPTPPSMQPMRMKYLSNLRKDFEETILRMQALAQWKPETGTWWDEQFHILHLDEENRNKIQEESHNFSCSDDNILSPTSLKEQFENLSHTSSPGLEFQIKLPHNFQPLKSKFCGDNFQMPSSSTVKNPFMSPGLASDDMMMRLPHVDIVVSGRLYTSLFNKSSG